MHSLCCVKGRWDYVEGMEGSVGEVGLQVCH